jgi:hypothetical protein
LSKKSGHSDGHSERGTLTSQYGRGSSFTVIVVAVAEVASAVVVVAVALAEEVVVEWGIFNPYYSLTNFVLQEGNAVKECEMLVDGKKECLRTTLNKSTNK